MTDTSTANVEDVAMMVEGMGAGVGDSISALLRTILTERDTLRREYHWLMDRVQTLEDERDKARAEMADWRSQCLKAEAELGDIDRRVADVLHGQDSVRAYAEEVRASIKRGARTVEPKDRFRIDGVGVSPPPLGPRPSGPVPRDE